MRNLLLLIPLIFLTSCATIINRKDYNISVSTDVSKAKAVIHGNTYNLPAKFKIKRSKQDLKIKLISDSIEKDFLVKASPNGAFLYGNLIWFYGAPAAYLIDFTNQRRFYYGNSIFLNSTDTLRIIRPNISKGYYNYWTKRYPSNKDQINFTVSLPWVNSFYFQPTGEGSKVNTGFLGISAGLEYYYKDNKYLALTGSGVMDFLFPIPAAVHIEGEVEKMNSIYITHLTQNYSLNLPFNFN